MTTTNDPPTLGTWNGFEVYPMPMFITLEVDDLARVTTWFEQTLGFRQMFAMPLLVHLRRRKYQDLLLVPSTEKHAAGSGLTITFGADGEVDAIAEQARKVSPGSVEGPFDTAHNTHDVRVTSPTGHTLVFTGRMANPDPERHAQWKKLFDENRKP